ncbi:MAG: hypothetical protein WD906_00695 [Anaerolineales bacterium]
MTTSIEALRTSHPDQSRIDQWSADTLRQTAGATRVREDGFLSPRRGLVPALRDHAQPQNPPGPVEPAER